MKCDSIPCLPCLFHFYCTSWHRHLKIERFRRIKSRIVSFYSGLQSTPQPLSTYHFSCMQKKITQTNVFKIMWKVKSQTTKPQKVYFFSCFFFFHFQFTHLFYVPFILSITTGAVHWSYTDSFYFIFSILVYHISKTYFNGEFKIGFSVLSRSQFQSDNNLKVCVFIFIGFGSNEKCKIETYFIKRFGWKVLLRPS